MLCEAYTQREAQGMYDLPSLTEQELREHEALWVER
jgi:hypothetical protein